MGGRKLISVISAEMAFAVVLTMFNIPEWAKYALVFGLVAIPVVLYSPELRRLFPVTITIADVKAGRTSGAGMMVAVVTILTLLCLLVTVTGNYATTRAEHERIRSYWESQGVDMEPPPDGWGL